MKVHRDWRHLAQQLVEAGFRLDESRRKHKHLKFKHPDGRMLTMPNSPSDSRRGLKNAAADVRRLLGKGDSTCQPK